MARNVGAHYESSRYRTVLRRGRNNDEKAMEENWCRVPEGTAPPSGGSAKKSDTRISQRALQYRRGVFHITQVEGHSN